MIKYSGLTTLSLCFSGCGMVSSFLGALPDGVLLYLQPAPIYFSTSALEFARSQCIADDLDEVRFDDMVLASRATYDRGVTEDDQIQDLFESCREQHGMGRDFSPCFNCEATVIWAVRINDDRTREKRSAGNLETRRSLSE